jgi:DNA-directed RNA polymerase beta subunit
MYKYLPDLLAVQLASFRQFLAHDLVEELQNGLHGLPTSVGRLCVDAEAYHITPPNPGPQGALQQIRTYGTTVYVPITISAYTAPTVVYGPHYHAVMRLPVLTETSYFIVNGVRRVVVNQMVRCPNIYCKTKVLANNVRSYTISFVCDRGVWLRFERDKKGELWVRMSDFAKIDLHVFLRALGISDHLLDQTFPFDKYSSREVDEGLLSTTGLTRGAALKVLAVMKGSKNKTKEDIENELIEARSTHLRVMNSSGTIGREFLYQTLFGGHTYSFTQSGRLRINRRFGLNSEVTTFQPEDALAGLYALFRLEQGDLQDDDIDHLQNRRVRLLQHLLSEQIRRGLKRTRQEKGIYLAHANGDKEILSFAPAQVPLHALAPRSHTRSPHPFDSTDVGHIDSGPLPAHDEGHSHSTHRVGMGMPFAQTGRKGGAKHAGTVSNYLAGSRPADPTIPDFTVHIKSKHVTRTLREFFGLNSLSQFMDQINPLSSITQKRRLTCLGPGGVSRQSGLDIRDIHPSHYGRICPIETPEGKNAGLVNSIASHATISPEGYVQSQYLSTLDGSPRPARIFLQPEHQLQRVFYPAPFRAQTHSKTAWLSSAQDTTGERWDASDVRFCAVSPIGMISVATSLIPFLEHDDGNRALMASNMQRQAVPLRMPERPRVGTGMEGRVARDSRTALLARTSGYVTYVDSTSIVIIRSPESDEGSGQHYVRDHYSLHSFARSNHDTLMYQHPCISDAKVVHRGDVLTKTSTICDGELSLGKNILVAYMPWEGYNFEDAVVLNQRMVIDQSFTSIHIEKFRTHTAAEKGEEEEFYIPHPKHTRAPQTAYDRYGILRPGTCVTYGTVLVGKRRPQSGSPTPEERLLYDIFEVHRAPKLDCSLSVNYEVSGRVFETFFFPDRGQYTKGAVEVHLLISRPIQIGDKIAGRHGNKGIISNILPASEMPYLEDGTPLDIILNPLGVPSRMNVGQLFECLLGLAGTQLNQLYRICAFDEIYGPSASHYLVSSMIRRAADECWWMNASPCGFGKVRLFDGRTGVVFEHPVTVGVAYILKLIHLVDKKIHSRSIGPYALITQQPLKGRASGGGQRVGEMEVWALQGFSAAYLLQEILTLKADDCYGRYRVTTALRYKGCFPTPAPPESFRLLLSELRALCFNISYETNRVRTSPPRVRPLRVDPLSAPIDVEPLPSTT